jgi:predicted Zn-dependent peptidase
MIQKDSPVVNKTRLNNGIRIITRRIPHVRSVSMGVWVDVGARDESAEESGLSHFIEHMIFKGTTRRSAYQIAKEFDVIGGHTNAFTSMETTCYHAKVMDDHLSTMTDILCDILLNSVFDEREVEKERPVIFQEIGMVEDTPEEYIHMLSEHAYWGEHPLGRSVLGAKENVIGFDANAIKSFFRRSYQPEGIVIAAAGNLEHERFLDLVAPTFEAVPADRSMPERTPAKGHSQVGVHHRDLEQVHVCLEAGGVSATDPRRYAFSLLNTILGGNMSSRLFQEVRENRGLAYSIYSFMTSYVDSGMFGVYTAVADQQVREAVSVVLAELERIQTEPVSAGELRDAKAYTKGCLYLSVENVDNQMVRLAQNEIHFGEFIPLSQVVERIEAVTRDDIRQLAQTLFAPEALALTFLGPVTDKGPLEDLLPR